MSKVTQGVIIFVIIALVLPGLILVGLTYRDVRQGFAQEQEAREKAEQKEKERDLSTANMINGNRHELEKSFKRDMEENGSSTKHLLSQMRKENQDALTRLEALHQTDVKEANARAKESALQVEQLARKLDDLHNFEKARSEEAKTQWTGLRQEVNEMHFPTLPKGEKVVFTIAFESVGFLSKSDHLEVALSWPDGKRKPRPAFLQQIRNLYVLTGSPVGEEIQLIPYADVDKKATDRHWLLAWKYSKKENVQHKPVAFTYVYFFRDRIRVYWYHARKDLSDEEKGALRVALLELALECGISIGPRSDWGPRREGFSDLYFQLFVP